MATLQPSINLWVMFSVQLVGFVCAWLARFSEGSKHQTRCQWLFMLSLVAMGSMTMAAAIGLQPPYWLAPATTLALMILVAICDFSHSGRTSTRASGF
jgi:hypothetical protein